MRESFNGLIYDTEKSELLASHGPMPYGDGDGYLGKEQIDLYVTKNGHFFKIRTTWTDRSWMGFRKNQPSMDNQIMSARSKDDAFYLLNSWGATEALKKIEKKHFEEA